MTSNEIILVCMIVAIVIAFGYIYMRKEMQLMKQIDSLQKLLESKFDNELRLETELQTKRIECGNYIQKLHNGDTVYLNAIHKINEALSKHPVKEAAILLLMSRENLLNALSTMGVDTRTSLPASVNIDISVIERYLTNGCLPCGKKPFYVTY